MRLPVAVILLALVAPHAAEAAVDGGLGIGTACETRCERWVHRETVDRAGSGGWSRAAIAYGDADRPVAYVAAVEGSYPTSGMRIVARDSLAGGVLWRWSSTDRNTFQVPVALLGNPARGELVLVRNMELPGFTVNPVVERFDRVTGLHRSSTPLWWSGFTVAEDADASASGAVVVGGTAWRGGSRYDAFVSVFDPAGLRWTAFRAGPGNQDDDVASVTFSPDGTKVYALSNLGVDAYRTSTGELLWRTTGTGFPIHPDALWISSDGQTLLTLRQSGGTQVDALDAATGALKWARSIPASQGAPYYPFRMHVDEDAQRIIVSGYESTSSDDVILAMTFGGAVLWKQTRNEDSFLADLELDDHRLFTTVDARSNKPFVREVLTTAQDTATGAVLWTARYAAEPRGQPMPTDLAIGYGGDLLVAGTTPSPLGDAPTLFGPAAA